MRKVILLCALIMVLILLLAGCRCDHEWYSATCAAPKTCSLCGETEGESLPHTWENATCTAPKTCSACKTTEGEALPHTWEDATCTVPKTCAVCKTIEGEALPHTWEDATCTVPKTCSVCKTTEGEVLPHTWQDATCTVPKTCSVCQVTEGETAEHTWQEATCTAPKTCSVCQLTEGKTAEHRWTGATCIKAGVCSVCGVEGETTNHKWTGATCTEAGVCSVCNATGEKTDHKYTTVSDKAYSEMFAGKRTKKCESCGNEKKEYYSESYVYDLDEIGAKIADYAKQRGFQVSLHELDEYDYYYSESVWELERFHWGPDKLISGAKGSIDRAYDRCASTPAGIGAYTAHIDVYYTQNAAFGLGYFGVHIEITS